MKPLAFFVDNLVPHQRTKSPLDVIRHEVSHPLGLAFAQLENLLHEGQLATDDKTVLHQVLQHLEQVKGLLKAHPAQDLQAPLSLQDAVFFLFDAYQQAYPYIQWRSQLMKGVALYTEVPQASWHQLVSNAVQNAIEALDTVQHPVVMLDVHVQEENCVVEIHDSGPGFPEVFSHAQLVQPYVSTKEVTLETANTRGLGLHVCSAIVQAHGGELVLGKSPLGGALFRVVLPCVQEVLG